MENTDEVWLTSQEMALRLKVEVCTLDKWAYTGFGPHFIKAGRVRRYPISDVVAWEQALLAEAKLKRQFVMARMRHQAA